MQLQHSTSSHLDHTLMYDRLKFFHVVVLLLLIVPDVFIYLFITIFIRKTKLQMLLTIITSFNVMPFLRFSGLIPLT